MEGGARVWGVQGGETVAGEGGALSVSRSCRRAGLSRRKRWIISEPPVASLMFLEHEKKTFFS